MTAVTAVVQRVFPHYSIASPGVSTVGTLLLWNRMCVQLNERRMASATPEFTTLGSAGLIPEIVVKTLALVSGA
jgi:hypothetical protein